MSTLYVDNIYSKTGTSQALTIDSSGLVVMPQRPHFFVHKTSAQGSLSAGAIISFQSVLRNNGSHWDSTNHKFVAPVDGVYMFNLNWLSYSGSAVMDCSIAKNGTYIAHSRHPNLSGVASSNHNTTTLSISYYLDANDEIDVRGNAFSGNSTNGIYGDSNYWTTFNGFLVG